MKHKEYGIDRPARGLFWIMTIFCFALVATPTADGQDDLERELQAVEKKAQLLLEKAEKLQQSGKHEEAEELRHKAEDLRARIEHTHAQRARERKEGRSELEEVLHGLEYGMVALEKLGRHEEMEMLARVADDVRAELRGRRKDEQVRSEREIGLHQIEVMRLAMKALLEADRRDSAEILEHAIHACELAMEGRRDEKAMEIRKSGPELGVQVEILMYAADLWDEVGHEGKAGTIRELAGVFRKKLDRQKEARARGDKERDEARHQLEIMKSALHVLKEVGIEDAADILKRAIQTRVVNLEGMRGDEANMVRERNPPLEQQVEILGLASRLCREWGNEEKARTIGGLAEQMWAHRKQRAAVQQNVDVRRIRELEEKIGHMARQIEELKEALRELQRER